MPYIKDKKIRNELDDIVGNFLASKILDLTGKYSYFNITEHFSDIGIAGNLNYFIFKIARQKPNRIICSKLSYTLYWMANDLCHSYTEWSRFITECECSKREIIRRIGKWKRFWLIRYLNKTIDKIYDKQLAHYEDIKIKENGDVA